MTDIRRCACVRLDAADCMAARYGYEHDLERDYWQQEECECACHDEEEEEA